ncbi:T9SS type A sorting domain-containing protein [candidate division KSB1 bacterium]|nr:T9SS type A sorting domain-containing protein [candidate division KSB1 bacterium]
MNKFFCGAIIILLTWANAPAQTSEWIVYNRANSGLPDDAVYAIALEDHAAWIGTASGLAKYANSAWTVYDTLNSPLPHPIVSALASDRNGIVWIGTSGGGLASFDGTSWTVYDSANSGLPSNGVLSLALEGSALWVGTGDGLARFDGTEWKTFHSSTSGLPDNFVFALAVDPRGNKWIGTLIGGLALYRADGVQTAVASPAFEPPGHFSLAQNYPNPFNPQTTIVFSLPKANRVTLKIYNVQGREVATLLHRESKAAGHHEAGFTAGHLPSGVCLYRLETDSFVATKKMLLVR